MRRRRRRRKRRVSSRINLIGEHTDYLAGFVMPATLALGTWTVAAPRDDGTVRVLSEGQGEIEQLQLSVAPSAARNRWSDYIAGVTWALQQAGVKLRGADLLVASDVPMGSGLSSSAALEVSVAYALLAVANTSLSSLEIALVCQRAENEFVGARCGVMDQFAATHGQPGRALMLFPPLLRSATVRNSRLSSRCSRCRSGTSRQRRPPRDCESWSVRAG